jgi:hypothetical protein
VSLLSSSEATIEEIAHLVGHGSTSVTERVYQKDCAQSSHAGRAPHRALRWQRQAIGLHSLAEKSTDPSTTRRARSQNGRLTRAFFVGDTGFEPVTSSASVISGTPDNASAGVNEVRACAQMIAGCLTD